MNSSWYSRKLLNKSVALTSERRRAIIGGRDENVACFFSGLSGVGQRLRHPGQGSRRAGGIDDGNDGDDRLERIIPFAHKRASSVYLSSSTG